MRLLNVCDPNGVDDLPKLVEFLPDKIPTYAILSHRWNASPSEEILFADLMRADDYSWNPLREKQGYSKFQSSCAQARKLGFGYLWIDTCCIDKSSSAELSEAINSMYAWYNQAQVCFVYLADVPSSTNLTRDDSEFIATGWATRGWTLQELLAPPEVIFYSSDWQEIGTRDSLKGLLSAITGIDEEYLAKDKPRQFWLASIAKRMSWAARRETSRPEDIAYCLMGLFQVNMPLLYGEGEKAFIRLQEEIMKHSDDHSLFAWTDEDRDDTAKHGLLARHPRCFQHSGSIAPYEAREMRAPFSMSNQGLCIELHLSKLDDNYLYAAALYCPVPPAYNDSSFLAIYLEKLPMSPGQYARVKVKSLGEIIERGFIETIYVRQSIIIPDIEGVYPTHFLQLRNFIAQDCGYRVARTMRQNDLNSSADEKAAIKSTQSAKRWVPAEHPTTCKITNRGGVHPLLGVQIVFKETESIVILLGAANLQVGFGVSLESSIETSFEARFVPLSPSTSTVIGYHRVCVSAEPLISKTNAKYYMIDIQIDALERPRNLVEGMFGAFDELVTDRPQRSSEGRWTGRQRLRWPFRARRSG